MTREEALERVHDPHPPPLDDAEQSSFEDWLARDAELGEIDAEQHALFAAMDGWENVEPSAAFDERLRVRVEAERSRPNLGGVLASWLSWPRAAWASCAVAMLAAAAVWLGPGRRSMEPPPAAKVASSAEDAEFLRELDRALDDMEMLIDFEVLAPPAGEDRS